MITVKTHEIEKGIYWAGVSGNEKRLSCNPYLLVEGEEAVLFDPGSVLDFEQVFRNVCSIVPLEKIKYVVLHHQNADVCSSVPLFEQMGCKFKVIAHLKTVKQLKYYGIKSECHAISKDNLSFSLKSGRVLEFIETDYLPVPGAMATYDTSSRILFSSDLFGAPSKHWSLYAKGNYLEEMKAYHKQSMPLNDSFLPVMNMFLKMDISMIAPRQGSIIRNAASIYIRSLRDMECEALMESLAAPQEQTQKTTSTSYGFLVNSLRNKLQEIIGIEGALEAAADLETYEPGKAEVNSQILSETMKLAEEAITALNEENLSLKAVNAKLRKSVKAVEEKLTRCPVTKLYNYDFFKKFMSRELEGRGALGTMFEVKEESPALIVISVDNMAKIRYAYGDNEVDETLRNIAYTIESIKDEYTEVFRLQGAMFACYLPDATGGRALGFADELRNAIALSEKFIEKITVSIGMVTLEELMESHALAEDPSEELYEAAIMRVKLAKSKGMNIVCSSSYMEDSEEKAGKVMIVDTDQVNIDVLKTFLENLDYKVLVAKDGEEALKLSETESLNVIVSEIMLPKLDGFILRENLLTQSSTKNIPFIIVSHLKNEDSVKRASSLKVEHYFKKPFLVTELLGVINNKVKGEVF